MVCSVNESKTTASFGLHQDNFSVQYILVNGALSYKCDKIFGN